MTLQRTLTDQLRDATGIGYSALTHVFAPTFTTQVATWPILTVLPLRPPPQVDLWITSLLRRDLAFAGAVSVLGFEDTPQRTYDAFLGDLRQSARPLPWKYLAGVGAELRDGQVSLYGRLLRVGQLDSEERLSVEGPVAQLAELTLQFAERFAQALQLTPSPRAHELWRQGRPVSWDSLLACARAWQEEDGAWMEAALTRGEIHPDALVLTEGHDDAQGHLRRASILALSKDPSHPQLGFTHFCRIWRGTGRDSAGARVLTQGLRDAPGHGKSQMCLAHMFFPRSLDNSTHILAHAEAGYRLLPGNNFAMSNFMGYLDSLAPRDPRRARLMQEMLDTSPEDPRILKQAMDFYIQVGRPRVALDLALHFQKLVTEPINPRTLYCFRQNPVTAAALASGQFKPLDDALRCVGLCEQAVRKAEQG